MSHVSNHKYWKAFFQLYRNMPELWDTSCVEYKNKRKKQLSYERLVNKYREYDAEANLDTLKKKLHNIRSSVGRECRKVNRSIQNGYDATTVYKPTLWYYYELSFLRTRDDQGLHSVLNENDASSLLEGSYRPRPVAKCKKQTSRTSKKMERRRNYSNEPIAEQCYNSNDDRAEDEKIAISHEMNDWSSDGDVNNSGSFFTYHEIPEEQLNNQQTSVAVSYQSANKECEGSAKRKKLNIKPEMPAMSEKIVETDPLNVKNMSDNLSIEMTSSAGTSFVQPFPQQDNRRDEAQIYAEGWATSYRKLSKSQRIMARKAIEEIFFLGEMEQLTTVVVQMPTT